MTKLPVEVREFQEGDIPAIVSLLAEHLCLPRFDETYFRWKYLENPNGQGVCIVALVNDRVVGVSGLIPYEGSIGDHHCRIWFGTDSLVHPHYRRQGIFLTMVTEMNRIARGRGADVLFSFTSRMSHGGFLKTRTYREAGLLDYNFTLIRPLDRKSGQKPVAPLRRCLTTLLDALPARRRSMTTRRNYGLVPLDLGNPTKDALSFILAGIQRDYVSIAKSPSFIRWRYAEHPWHHGAYEAWGITKQETPIGYLIMRGANIIDIGVGGARDDWDVAIGMAVGRARDCGNEDLHAYTSGPPALKAAFRRAGFVRWNYVYRPLGLYPQQVMVVNLLDDVSPELSEAKSISGWVLQMGDIDCGL